MAGRPAWLRAGFWRVAEPPLSPAVTGVAALGAVVLVVGCVLTSGSDPDGSAAASAPVGADAATVQLTTWYTSTQGVRASIATSIQAVRAALDAQDGSSLQPQCVQLAGGTKAAARLQPGPDAQAQQMLAGGVEHYAAAAASCLQLFDGTQIPVPELQTRVRTALADGDRQWQALATRAGLPVAVPLRSGEPSTTGPAPSTAPGAVSDAASDPAQDDAQGQGSGGSS
ncbi:hypothetical protein CC117_15615 [Parafrankia colletiae]|uniref:Uncharacterized protein n=1 Tax=Parafrankia colletiae TaxID=573497 RepID=A0A1S1QUJ1_9ACTN|nr:hypothetical protein [Parafrankia colletiae]MCK9898817.1 hypothetical protein [Frankia sp. Cpl3]OHV38363.1 hypothetical protein CC117_15615 [Parafrankia colletiae]